MGGGSKASGGGSKGVSRGDVCRVDKRHDSSRPCPSGGEGRYSAHDVCYKGRVYSDKGRADGCYDRTDKFCTTGSSYPSAHSTSRGGEGRGGTSGSSGTHRESRSSENTSYTSKQHIDKSVDFRKSKDYESALKSCDAALQADPKYLDGWNENAAIYIDKAEYKKAIESCDKAIKIDQKYFYAYNNKAVALRMSGDYENALKSCDEALKINPQYSDAQNEKSKILDAYNLKAAGLITKKQYGEAIKACDTIINSDPKNLFAYHKKIMALKMLENYEIALKSCDKIISYMGNIDNYGIGKVEELNQLYLTRKQQHIEAAAKRDYLYNQSVINGVNGFDWYKANPTRDFYSFFRDTLKVSHTSPENVKLIKERLYKNLSPYLEEAKKSNYFFR